MAKNGEGEGGSSGILVAFVLGAAVGAALALLYAPASGRETREFLGEKAREGREKAAATAQKTREVIREQRQTIATAIERGRDAYREARGKENG